MDELIRFQIADHKLSLLSPLHKQKEKEHEEIGYRYAHGCGKFCDYFYPYLYVRIYISGGVWVQGCGYQEDFGGESPLITKTFRIYAPQLKGLPWMDEEGLKDKLFSENKVHWVRGKGYVCDAPFEDYTADLKSKRRIWENLRKQEYKALDAKYEKTEQEYEYWLGIWRDSERKLNQVYAATQPFNIGTLSDKRLVDGSQIPTLWMQGF